MATSGSLFSQTLQDITTTKLDELSKKHAVYEQQKSTAIQAAKNQKDAVEMLTTLTQGVKDCFGLDDGTGVIIRGSTTNPRLVIDLRNLDRFLKQARYDPSISNEMLKKWHRLLLRYLDSQSSKLQYASLFGQLTMEWLSTAVNPVKSTIDDGDAEMSENFEEVSSGDRLEARLQWEKSVFEAAKIDTQALSQFLIDLFEAPTDESKAKAKVMKWFRSEIKDFEAQMASSNLFTTGSLSWVISGLTDSDLLTEEKRAVLRDFKESPIILSEIADVLNMRLANLQAWSWGDAVLVEERRQINGSYNIYMHEDLLQAILLQFIGVKWSIFFHNTFSRFCKTTSIWNSSRKSLSETDQARLVHYLGSPNNPSNKSLSARKQSLYRQSYFVSHLLSSEWQTNVIEEGEEEADYERAHSSMKRRKQTARMVQQPMQQAPVLRKRKASARFFSMEAEAEEEDEDEDESDYQGFSFEEDVIDDDFGSGPKNPMEAKQTLLHLLSTDITMNSQLHGETTCFRAQFESWNSSMPHDAIKTILSFFGLSEKWLNFFEKFLKAPLKFQDEPDSEPRRRERGAPGSHVLSEVFSEIMLFCLDFMINQTTDGEILWRNYDDFWFWSSDHAVCVKAWDTINRFCKVMNVELNLNKAGTVRIPSEAKKKSMPGSAFAIDPSLPKGQIRWGMIYLDTKSGGFEIDQELVDHHVNELCTQLRGKEKSLFTWIQAWNTYAAVFFTSNFGIPANCFGRQHVDTMLATHERIQRMVFKSTTPDDSSEVEDSQSGSVAKFLKSEIEKRFGITDIPDGYLYFPFELGGLEVRSPFVRLLQTRDALIEDPKTLMTEYTETEREEYRIAKTRFEKNSFNDKRRRRNVTAADLGFPEDRDPAIFMPFEEFVQSRAVPGYPLHTKLYDIFTKMMDRPSEVGIDCDENSIVKTSLNALSSHSNLRGILANWHSMEPYWKWVAQLYAPEIIERFGGFHIVDPVLLPIGMVSMFRSGRVSW